MHLPNGANGPQEMFLKLNQALNCWELLIFWIGNSVLNTLLSDQKQRSLEVTGLWDHPGIRDPGVISAHPSFQMGCVLFLSLCDLELWGGIVCLRIFWCFTIQCDSDVKMYISLYFQEKVFNWWQNGTSLVLEWG